MTLPGHVSRSALLVRVLVVGTGLAALMLAVPAGWFGAPVTFAAIAAVAAVPAIAAAVVPGRWVVVVAELVVVALWLIPSARSDAASWMLAAVLAPVLYAHHCLASVAALGIDVELRRSVVVGWLRRLGPTAGAGVAVALVVGVVTDSTGVTVSEWFLLIGLVLALVVAGFPVWWSILGRSSHGRR